MKHRTMGFGRNILIILIAVMAFSCKKDNKGLVVGKIQKASKLATTQFTIDKIVHGTKAKKLGWFIKLNEAQFIAYSKAIITAGVDLQQLGKEAIEIDEKRISLTLPAIEVLNFSYSPADFVMDTQLSGDKWANNITVFDQEAFFRRAELDIRNNLEYMGIVETTQQKTRSMLSALLRSLGYDEIYIDFASDELVIDRVPQEDADS